MPVKRTYHFFIALIAILVSCSRTAEVEIPEHSSRLVVHGYVAVGDTIQLTMGRSVAANRLIPDSAMNVPGGWVLLYEDNLFRDSLKYDDLLQRYVSRMVTAQTGRTYRIRAGAPGFPEVEAMATAPARVPTLQVSQLRNARTTSDGMLLNDVTFRFRDPAPEKNYYLAALYSGIPGFPFLCVYTYDPAVERYTGSLIPFGESSCINNEQILFSDRSFNGAEKEITLSGEAMLLDPFTDPVSGSTTRACLKRYNISAEYYTYFKNTLSLGFDAGSPTMADPIQIKGNIKNGYGLFTIYSVAIDSLP